MRLPHGSTLFLTALWLAAPASLLAQANVLTWHNDNARTGQNPGEVILTPQKVTSANFGRLFNVALDGSVDAQPLYVSAVYLPGQGTHNVVYAATEHDSVYAIDADTGKILWKTTLLPAGETPSDNRNCGQVPYEIGVTATPVVDLAKGFLYVVAMSKDAAGAYHQRVHGLWLTSGAEEYGSPFAVAATAAGTGDGSSKGVVTFNPAQYKDRPGLLLVGNQLYTSWSSHCDDRPYNGWMISYSTSTGAQTGVFNFAPNGSDAAPWNAGAGPAADSSGNVFIAVGNGTFDTAFNAQGFPASGDYGNAVVKLGNTGNGLKALDYWTMYNSNALSANDVDLGSGGLMLLPAQKNSAGQSKSLAVVAGKDSNMYVLDQSNLGKYDVTNDGTLYQQLSGALSNGVWSSPAYFNGHVYYGSVSSVLRSFDVNNALLASSPSSSTPTSFGYPGATPSVSSDGSTSGIVWAVESSSPAVLHAYDATNLATELYNSDQAGTRDHFGNGNKFMTPTIANGKVYIGTPNSIAVFGYRGSATAPLPDGNYNLTNSASSLLLTDYAASPSSSTEIVQLTQYNGNYQTWFLSWQGNGYYVIQNMATGYLLSAPEGRASNGTPARHLSAVHDDTQLWSLASTGSGYTLVNKSTGLVLGDPGANKNPAALHLETAANTANQVWSVQAAH